MRKQVLPLVTEYEEDKFYLKPPLKEMIQERKRREDEPRNNLVV